MRPLTLNKSGGENKAGVFRPQLTSLVDVMTILLVFLIKSFSVENSLVTPPTDLDLPISTSEKLPQPRLALSITREEIIEDSSRIVSLDEIEGRDSLLIEPLFAHIQKNKERCMIDTAASVLIQCDKEVDFSVVKKVMFTCSKAGVKDFSVLVIREE
ncbi:MAG: ExbD/TolR family protein [Chitinispirillaceae bacterium]